MVVLDRLQQHLTITGAFQGAFRGKFSRYRWIAGVNPYVAARNDDRLADDDRIGIKVQFADIRLVIVRHHPRAGGLVAVPHQSHPGDVDDARLAKRCHVGRRGLGPLEGEAHQLLVVHAPQVRVGNSGALMVFFN
jgi:hypothetical protein